MKKITFLLGAILSFGIFSCKKDATTEESPKIDISKFVDKKWFLNGNRDSLNSTSMFRTYFNSDHTGGYSQCVWIVPPYRYSDLRYKWERQGEDTIVIDGWYKLKIRLVNDTMLVTNGLWIFTGIQPGVIDTTSITFKCF